MSQSYVTFKGTAKQFEAAGVKVNGHHVDAIGLSIMARYGVAKVVGQAEKDPKQRGRAPAIYQVTGKSGFKVEVANQAIMEAEEQKEVEQV